MKIAECVGTTLVRSADLDQSGFSFRFAPKDQAYLITLIRDERIGLGGIMDKLNAVLNFFLLALV